MAVNRSTSARKLFRDNWNLEFCINNEKVDFLCCIIVIFIYISIS